MKHVVLASSVALLSTFSHQSHASEIIQYPAALVCAEHLPNGTPSTIEPYYPNREKFSVSNGSLYVRASAYVHCSFPYHQGRYIEKVSIDLSGHLIDLRSCSFWAMRIGSSDYYGNAPTTEKSVTTEYAFTDLGVQDDGSTLLFSCLTFNQPSSSQDGYTRFWNVSVQYADQ